MAGSTQMCRPAAVAPVSPKVQAVNLSRKQGMRHSAQHCKLDTVRCAAGRCAHSPRLRCTSLSAAWGQSQAACRQAGQHTSVPPAWPACCVCSWAIALPVHAAGWASSLPCCISGTCLIPAAGQACPKYLVQGQRRLSCEGLTACLHCCRQTTGWQIRPVAGLLHPRDFLNGLAFKCFHSTQVRTLQHGMLCTCTCSLRSRAGWCKLPASSNAHLLTEPRVELKLVLCVPSATSSLLHRLQSCNCHPACCDLGCILQASPVAMRCRLSGRHCTQQSAKRCTAARA